jgi:hypothetical protein
MRSSNEDSKYLRNELSQRKISCCLFRASFLFGLILDTEDEDHVFLRIVGWISPDYTTLHPRRLNSPYVSLRSINSASEILFDVHIVTGVDYKPANHSI